MDEVAVASFMPSFATHDLTATQGGREHPMGSDLGPASRNGLFLMVRSVAR